MILRFYDSTATSVSTFHIYLPVFKELITVTDPKQLMIVSEMVLFPDDNFFFSEMLMPKLLFALSFVQMNMKMKEKQNPL